MDAFEIRRPDPSEADVLFDIWWRSARATHAFLSEQDLRDLAPLVRDLGLVQLDTWVLCEQDAGPIGFLVMKDCEMEGLFIAPEWLRRGGGKMLVQHARSLHGRLTVEVNEQNGAALRFYQSQGFSIVGRSETDRNGRPFPLVHLAESPAGSAADVC